MYVYIYIKIIFPETILNSLIKISMLKLRLLFLLASKIFSLSNIILDERG